MSTTTSFKGGPQNQTITYQYNQDGSRLCVEFPVLQPNGTVSTPGNESLSYGGPGEQGYYYDGIGRLQTVKYSGGFEDYDYYSNGWLKDEYFDGGYGPDFAADGTPSAYASYQYDPRGEVTGLLNQLTGDQPLSVSANFSMLNADGSSAYDAAGNRLSEAAYYAGTKQSDPPGSTIIDYINDNVSYTYDNRDELTSVSQSSIDDGVTPSSIVDLESYLIDAVANIRNFNGTARGIDADNEDNTSTLYDGEGNPNIAANGFAQFDPENHLTGITSATPFAAQYDSGGHRTALNFNGQGWTYYLYDGDEPIEEMNSGGYPVVNNFFGADGFHFKSTVTGGIYYAYDPQGNPAQQMGASGEQTPILWSAYGNRLPSPTQQPTSLPNLDGVGFGGKYGYRQDPTGLYLLGSRYYDPTNGRFLTRDPTGYQAGPNLYAYCEGNPITRCDPEGTNPTQDHQDDNQMALGQLDGVSAAPAIKRQAAARAADEKRSDDEIMNLLTCISMVDGAGELVAGGRAVLAGGAKILSAVAAKSAAKEAAAHAAEGLGPEGEALLKAVSTGDSAFKSDMYHYIATFMREDAAKNGTHFVLDEGGPNERVLTQLEGGANGKPGRFEYVVRFGDQLVHERFVENGTINGKVNVP